MFYHQWGIIWIFCFRHQKVLFSTSAPMLLTVIIYNHCNHSHKHDCCTSREDLRRDLKGLQSNLDDSTLQYAFFVCMPQFLSNSSFCIMHPWSVNVQWDLSILRGSFQDSLRIPKFVDISTCKRIHHNHTWGSCSALWRQCVASSSEVTGRC